MKFTKGQKVRYTSEVLGGTTFPGTYQGETRSGYLQVEVTVYGEEFQVLAQGREVEAL